MIQATERTGAAGTDTGPLNSKQSNDTTNLIELSPRHSMQDTADQTILFTEVTPRQNHASLADALDAAVDYLNRFITFDPEKADTVALWIAHTWAFQDFDFTPYLHIFSADKRCGKSRLGDVALGICYRPLPMVNPTGPGLYRMIDHYAPSVLVDEIDQSMKDKEDKADIIAVLNAGFEKGRPIPRLVGTKHTPKVFQVYSPKILIGIGHNALPDTVRDRSIPIQMHRRIRNDEQKFRKAKEKPNQLFLAESFAHFAKTLDYAATEPTMPDDLDERALDIWEPLFAIAQAAGRDWPERAAKAAKALSTDKSVDQDSIRVRLLSDIFDIFHPADSQPIDRIHSSTLRDRLHALEESPWADYNWSPSKIARELGNFDIRSKQIRHGTDSKKGYDRTSFINAWRAFLPNRDIPESNEPKQTALPIEPEPNPEPDSYGWMDQLTDKD